MIDLLLNYLLSDGNIVSGKRRDPARLPCTGVEIEMSDTDISKPGHMKLNLTV